MHTRNAISGLLHEGEVLELIPLSRDSWRRMTAAGVAPKPVRLGKRRVYDAREIAEFIEKLIAARDAKLEDVRDAA
jgi:predicted DNA-binding transcriptional regulator AlpA